MNFNPYASYFYHGDSKEVYQINYETGATKSFDYSSENLYASSDYVTDLC